MKAMKYRILTVFSLVFILAGALSAGTIDPLLERLDISGFLRMRAWYFGSSTFMDGNFPGGTYEQANYEDVFFRNRFHLKVLPNLEVRTVFDISAKFGAEDFAIGNGGTNIITRNVYALFCPMKEAELALGLMPFSLPGGYILARDATGIRYSHNLLRKRLKLSASFVRAFDDADTILSSDTDNPDYADDNIWIAEGKIAFLEGLTTDAYYVGQYDNFTSDDDDPDTDDDGRHVNLHWIGLSNSYTSGPFTFKLGGILNFGEVKTRSINSDPFVKTDIIAGLWEVSLEYTWRSLKVALVHEGATGDPASADDEHSFQDIKASHGFSFIVADNTGGLAVRGSGESTWYGLCGQGLKLYYILFDAVTTRFGYYHFRTLEKVSTGSGSSSWYGDEVNLSGECRYREALSIFLTAGIFIPQGAYRTVTGHDDKGAIVEVMLGTKISY